LLIGLTVIALIGIGREVLLRTAPGSGQRIFWVALMLALLALGGFLALRGTGAVAAIPAFIGVLIAWLFRHGGGFLLGRLLTGMLGRAATAAAGGGPRPGTSQVQGLVLRMTLDHASGELAGEVLSGPLAGRPLRSLSTDEMRALYTECSARCERSLRLLESWLDRYGGDWREHVDPAEQGAATATGPMTRAEALRVLGLDDDADVESVQAAHRRLQARLHPDAGGTDHLSAMVNEARDVLMGGQPRRD
jgi:hypothetical protein